LERRREKQGIRQRLPKPSPSERFTILARNVEACVGSADGPENVMRILDAVEQLRASLDYHLARHNMLTANLAHVDTPGFRPLDLERAGHFEGALQTALATTQPGHISAPHASVGGEAWRVVEGAPGQGAGTDGNGVSLDREAVKIATNQIRYDTLASLVQNELSGLAWAANDGKAG
jgi:flagellar basal-body rod protein FlgB